MKLITIFKNTLLLCLAIGVAGCASDLKYQSAAEIEQQTKIEAFPGSPNQILSAPELQVRHFQEFLYGSNSVSYYLTAHKDSRFAGNTSYWLEFDANYGSSHSMANSRRYDMAKTETGLSIPTYHLRHETLRCQEYKGVGDGCLYRDRAEVQLSLADLEAGRHSGLKLILSSANQEYEHIDLPAQYVDGFLRAVQSQ
ncbi:hypothetical protein KEF85_02490 [Methylomonas paludis]|uniref:Lipoprotein n=1 Tax=Methylomonas paludis TaxID=1173101 RepID=A0A975MP35_9GAMM|nr:hypothetical protein [Methylomonas paludis]QWF71377.1 hypothetical protein KEF85_02490 [Methylomonas paludis]